jgi:hypothetical protein
VEARLLNNEDNNLIDSRLLNNNNEEDNLIDSAEEKHSESPSKTNIINGIIDNDIKNKINDYKNNDNILGKIVLFTEVIYYYLFVLLNYLITNLLIYL